MQDRVQVIKQAGKDFTVLQITDTQIIDPKQMAFPARLCKEEQERWVDIEKNCLQYVRKLVEDTKPDLIVLTGDNVYGSFDADASNFKRLTDYIDGFGIPWAPIFGNHDGETYDLEDPRGSAYPWGKGYEWQMDYWLHSTKNCLFRRGPAGIDKSRHGNYIVEVKENGKTVYTLFMMDSHDDITEPYGLTEEQMDWYAQKMEKIFEENGKTIPSMLFLHIPLYQHYLAIQQYFPDGLGVLSQKDEILPNGDWGELADPPSYSNEHFQKFSKYVWETVQKYGSTRAIVVGHYHTNACRIDYKGEHDAHPVQMVFGVKTSTYDYHKQLGGTLITIKDGNDTPVILPVYCN